MPKPTGTSTSSTSTTTTTNRTANGGIATTTTTSTQQIITSSTESSTFDDGPKLKADAWSFQSSQARSAFGGQPFHSYKKPSSNPSVYPAPLKKTSITDNPPKPTLQKTPITYNPPKPPAQKTPITYNPPKPTLQKTPITYNPPKPITKSEPPLINDVPLSKPIIVKKTSKLHYDTKVPTYHTTSKHRGSLLIINNIEFATEDRRDGADIDQKNMKKLFKQMGFTVRAHQNKTKSEMERIIRDHTKQRDLKKVDISVTIIMSHGTRIDGETHILAIDENETVSTEWVVQQFASTNCEYLQGKPKIFIFQCRGLGKDIQTDAKPFKQPRAQEDILIANATVPGYVSARVPDADSCYINHIVDVFMEHAHDIHIEDLLKIVDDGLAREHNMLRETSSYESRGFKRCYLNPVCSRSILGRIAAWLARKQN